jgi:hypothetical protein
MKLRLLTLLIIATLTSSGCQLFPEIARQPTLHNPFPQLSKVAVAPFFNLSNEPTVDGRKFALAYYNELQLVPGYEVVPVGVVEKTMRDTNNQLTGPEDARRLAQSLGVDAVVIGAITDYTPYYPPRCALQVEWYSANPGFHQVPPGYGLPWGTPEEQQIPGPLIFEAEMALAKEQMKTQTPKYPVEQGNGNNPPRKGTGAEATGENSAKNRVSEPPAALLQPSDARRLDGAKTDPSKARKSGDGQSASNESAKSNGTSQVKQASYETPGSKTGRTDTTGAAQNDFSEDWPDPRGFIPPPPRKNPPSYRPTQGPVMRHTQTYNGQDARFTEALASYYFFQDDARFGGWQNYLVRSDDFTRFCCRMHIWEMLTARGGAGESRVVWRWQTIR